MKLRAAFIAITALTLAATSACGGSDGDAGSAGPVGPRKTGGTNLCTAVPPEKPAERLGVPQLTHDDGNEAGGQTKCGWKAPVDGDGGVPARADAYLGFGTASSVAGVRARRRPGPDSKACTVSVALSGTTAPATDADTTDPALEVWFSNPGADSDQQVCDAAGRLAETLLHALPKA
ncbi:hypothetical protein NX801_25600 [Streptomyces sp. LP05-1]|uniref:DUF3558 domain-containing protein n=1 Tax=Streptomyces pyxinae TaxID=2970734 RepID=A0ABT2CNE7_9ACTN|nr:hypothetical protein [Streptomyces sp. LP05-1]MCS0638963.1 hypothetical protein [Streptomyces sp. LP05-1]